MEKNLRKKSPEGKTMEPAGHKDFEKIKSWLTLKHKFNG